MRIYPYLLLCGIIDGRSLATRRDHVTEVDHAISYGNAEKRGHAYTREDSARRGDGERTADAGLADDVVCVPAAGSEEVNEKSIGRCREVCESVCDDLECVQAHTCQPIPTMHAFPFCLLDLDVVSETGSFVKEQRILAAHVNTRILGTSIKPFNATLVFPLEQQPTEEDPLRTSSAESGAKNAKPGWNSRTRREEWVTVHIAKDNGPRARHTEGGECSPKFLASIANANFTATQAAYYDHAVEVKIPREFWQENNFSLMTFYVDDLQIPFISTHLADIHITY